MSRRADGFEERVSEIRACLEATLEPDDAAGVDLDWVARQVAVAPPLSDEQRAAWAVLLRVPAST